MNPLTVAKVAVEMADLQAENAKLRGFAETVASQSPVPLYRQGHRRPLETLNDLIDEANELLAKIDKGL